jgi:hypothetical protein
MSILLHLRLESPLPIWPGRWTTVRCHMRPRSWFLPRDADCDYFLQVLLHTSVGDRYIKALLVMRLAQLTIAKARREVIKCTMSCADAEQLIQSWRDHYALYSDRASIALDELNQLYDWPPESKVERSFVWEPLPAARRNHELRD